MILPSLLLTLDEYSSFSGEGCTNDSLSSPDYPQQSPVVRFGSGVKPDSYKCAEDGLNDGRI